jgi:hypothetical protein
MRTIVIKHALFGFAILFGLTLSCTKSTGLASGHDAAAGGLQQGGGTGAGGSTIGSAGGTAGPDAPMASGGIPGVGGVGGAGTGGRTSGAGGAAGASGFGDGSLDIPVASGGIAGAGGVGGAGTGGRTGGAGGATGSGGASATAGSTGQGGGGGSGGAIAIDGSSDGMAACGGKTCTSTEHCCSSQCNVCVPQGTACSTVVCSPDGGGYDGFPSDCGAAASCDVQFCGYTRPPHCYQCRITVLAVPCVTISINPAVGNTFCCP